MTGAPEFVIMSPYTAQDMNVLVTCCSNNNSYSVGKNSIKKSIDISFKLTINCYYAVADSAYILSLFDKNKTFAW